MLSIHSPMPVRIPEEAPDTHATLRFNVDDMSYEQLMELGESIGSVSTGLTETLISQHVTRRKFEPPTVALPDKLEKELCCICQDEYDEGADIARLACGHEYHFNCIQQWLVRKNDCPICKRKAIKL
ncbi:hypothetical protein CRG98_029491 [Punica granatum]|uniref:RING-type E3 ubiquitin transferase n=1 Tax=Punica granatum TaxID=22663 RepID=A0A2I0J1Q2_PUNGR|nr:hypothetical protein CRG98_029491 [Punica granatum]